VCDVLSACFCVAFAFTIWRVVGEEEPPSGGAPRCPVGQDKECVLKLSWPSTAEHRMMKSKKPGEI